jgi:hypothetical protein
MQLLLDTIKTCVPLSTNDEIVIKRLFREKKLTKGDHLLEAGNVCRYLAFIETGFVRYYIENQCKKLFP